MPKKPRKQTPTPAAGIPENKRSQQIIYGVLGLSYILYIIWGIASHSTWDDDCANRYFRTLNAFRDPFEFISLWNRPLFVAVFSIPVLILGKLAIPVVMSLISVTGAYFLYRAAREYRMEYAWLVIPFMLFQPFFLGTGRDAMTEPMAATILAWALYASLRKQWLVFALLGAALPLARTELALFLPIWAYLLFRAKQYKYIPLMGLGVVVWNIAGWIVTGDALYLFSETFGRADEENRYGSQAFKTYFERYLYVLGPVVFFFFLVGLINLFRKREFRPLVLIQFVVGFMLYVLLAWKITIGQSAGFLRNLIPLSPLAALIAVDGYGFFAESVKKRKRIFLLLLGCILTGGAIIFLFPYKLEMHHLISKTKQLDYLNMGMVAGLTLVLSACLILHKWVQNKHLRFLAIFLGIVTVVFALYTEPPDANMNSEREMINRMVQVYQECGFDKAPRTFCAHNWFHWVGGYIAHRKGSGHLGLLKDSLNTAPVGSIVIWENHYSNRVGNNVPQSELSEAKGFGLLATFYPEDATKVAYMYVKRNPEKTTIQYLNELITTHPDIMEFYLQRALFYMTNNNLAESEKDLQSALKQSPDNDIVKLNYANLYLKAGKFQEAIQTANQVLKSNEEFVSAYSIKGTAYFNSGDFNRAIQSFNEIIVKSKDNKEAYYNLGLSYLRLNKTDEACAHFTTAKTLNMPEADNMLKQYCAKASTPPKGMMSN